VGSDEQHVLDELAVFSSQRQSLSACHVERILEHDQHPDAYFVETRNTVGVYSFNAPSPSGGKGALVV
jgi:hypothetical protein